MKATYLIILIFVVGSLQAIAYPIPPQPLRKLVANAETIVYAKVVAIESIEHDQQWNDVKATLQITEVLQGKVTQASIQVFFSNGMICPAPAKYEKGTFVLAFLNKEGNHYVTQALSYGSKKLTSDAYSVYKQRILEIQTIAAIKNEQQKIIKTVEWLVTCAEHPVTRWEGVYELSPNSDFMAYYDDTIETKNRRYFLTESQTKRLRMALFKIEELNYEDLGLIGLTVQENDEVMLQFLIEKMRSVDVDTCWYTERLMEYIATIANRQDLKQIVAEMNAIDILEAGSRKKHDDLVRRFIKIM
ncbi:hypothetical protein [Neptunitalea lumnitzerae]|uniref:DUF4476 domain-containing protein n=1 Tax=Neptunitalea lumnitzerae TaxID=2965509 RepID=A0ABQ5MH63_9FLAO|nr:hypothetical protein [Neptunitalea sp. Y10]GLB48754.1 hypothetical protein Y10_11220 [Neptunitalea sp. Y10]